MIKPDTVIELSASLLKLEKCTGEPLSDPLKTQMEDLFGVDFTNVRIHQGVNAERIGAVAYTHGFDIYFSKGSFDPKTNYGLHLIAHELAHVVQQGTGRVAATSNEELQVVSKKSLEDEANFWGAQAMLQALSKSTKSRSTYHGAACRSVSSRSRVLGSLLQLRMPTISRTIQRQTGVQFVNDTQPGSSFINGMVHDRNLHGATQKDLASYLSGYDKHADAIVHGCTICNHHISYKSITAAVRKIVMDSTDLEALVQSLHALNPKLPKAQIYRNTDFGLAGPWEFQVGAVPPIEIKVELQNRGVKYYSKRNIDEQLDHLIWNLANDPRNLFYWKDHTGDLGGANLDVPRGAATGGIFSLAVVKLRLKQYHTLIQRMGLDV
jgi:hypothetical protein